MTVTIAVTAAMAVPVIAAMAFATTIAVAVAAFVSSAITFVRPMEVAEVIVGFAIVAVAGEAAPVAVTRIKAVIDAAVEAARTVEPRAGSVEAAAVEPIWTVVAVGRAVVGGVVKIAVGAGRGGAADIDADRDLCVRLC